ncbi:MAG TPA: CARDB domain-containing protein, partial [Thermoanaerobaculia bacterium]|nr:CARDB domain-containing protein [Thermoanaerobaculia bacterium]
MALQLGRRASFIFCLVFLAAASYAADSLCPPASPPVPASRLLYLGPVAGEYNDELAVRARLVDEAAAPMAARTVAFSFAGESRNATTGTDGIASAAFQVTAAPGSTALLISFAGDSSHPATQTSATIIIDRDETNLIYTGSPFLATGDVALAARLTHGNGDHAPLPVANRLIEFQLGTHVATAVTDPNGNASATINVPDAEVGAASLLVRFAGDAYYRESQDSRSTFVYQRSSFVIWGGNTAKPTIGQSLNFWGHSWSQQVTGGDYGAQSDFKGFATVIATAEPCQADAHLTASPVLVQGCWDSKPGQVPPPAQIARYIGAIVSTAIAKDQDTIYGNIAARVILEVSPDPAYGDDPGHPGYGKIVAVVSDGANLFPGPIITSALQQPESLLPGQAFVVQLTLNNGGTAAASALNVQASFDGATPASGSAGLSSLAPAESKSFSFNEQLGGIAQRGAAETTDAYLSRLGAEDGRIIASQTWTRFSDVSGAFFSPVLSVSASRLHLPILAMRISGISCALPGSVLPYGIELTNIGGAATASGSLLITLPDGSTSTLSVPALVPAASTVLNINWTVPVIAPKAAGETDAAYRARLASFDGKTLLLNGSLSWTDAAANQYGSTTAQFATIERVPILSITAGALPASATPGQSITATFTIQNLGSIASQPGRLIVLFPDATTTELSVAALASGASATLTATYTVPVIAAKGPSETDAAYRARLLSFDAQKLTFTGSLTWADANANSYGSISAQSETTERVPVLVLTAGALPASVLPNGTITPTYTIQNVGTGQASSAVLRVQHPDGTETPLAPLTIGGGQSVQINGPAFTVPAVAAKAPGETDAAYRARLQTFDGKQLTFTGTVNWADSNANSYGAISAQSATTERLPILVLTANPLSASVAPNETFTPAYTIQNIGSVQATNVILTVQDTPLAPLTIGGGASAQLNAAAYPVPTIAPKGASETDDVYRARLATFDNKVLTVSATLTWGEYGPVSQQTSTLEVVPILAIAMSAPANSLSGDPITYSITLTNSGHAAAQSFDLAVTMPNGNTEHPPSSVIPAGGTANLTL